MSSTTRIPKAEITGLSGYALKRISRRMLGEVPEPAEVMWHNRAVLTSMMGFGRKAEKWDQLDPNLKSFVHMAVAALVGCSWCLDLNYFHAHNEGLDEVKAREFPSGGSCLSGAAISNGTLYWGSGYSNLGFGTPNNKLYAFSLHA